MQENIINGCRRKYREYIEYHLTVDLFSGHGSTGRADGRLRWCQERHPTSDAPGHSVSKTIDLY